MIPAPFIFASPLINGKQRWLSFFCLISLKVPAPLLRIASLLLM